jgi:ABC-type Fe3+-hydroxamate transport system substrate-binding protein
MKLKFVDQMGAELYLAQKPKRIISLVPSQTELMADWGLEDAVVGITKFCIHPSDWFQSKTRVGGTKKLNFKVIASLEPDLIIGNKEENSKSDIEYLKAHYPVWMSDINNLEDCYEMMQLLGELLDCGDKAKNTVEKLKISFSKNGNPNCSPEILKVAYFIWQDPYMVAAADTFIDEMICKAGFSNVFENYKRYPEISTELLQQLMPDLIFLSSEPFPFGEQHRQFFQKMCPWAKVEIVDGELFSWYGSRLLKSAAYFEALRQKFLNI